MQSIPAGTILAVGVLAAAAQPSPAQETPIDRERLRGAFPFPLVQMKFRAFAGVSGDLLDPPRDDAATRSEVDDLRSRLRDAPSHAEGWARLGLLLGRLDEESEARDAHGKAARLLETRVKEARGDADPSLRIALGRAWSGAGNDREAIRVLEAVVTALPESAAARSELAGALLFSSMRRLLGADHRDYAVDLGRFVGRAPSSPEDARKSIDELARAAACLDFALERLPGSDELWVQRTVVRFFHSIAVACSSGASRPLGPEVLDPMVADLRKLLPRHPGSLRLLSAIVRMGTFRRAALNPPTGAPGDEERARLEIEAADLERLAVGARGPEAAEACRAAALHRQLVRGDREGARSLARRAVAADPGDDENWAVLAVCAVADTGRLTAADFDAAGAIAEERLKAGESVAFRLLAGKSAFRRGRWGDAETHLQAALRVEATNPKARLGLAATAIASGAPESLARSRSLLEQLFRESGELEVDDWACLSTQWGILHLVERRSASSDRAFADWAVQGMRKVLAAVPHYEPAKEVLRILGRDPAAPPATVDVPGSGR
jgi:cytochrome c-type biogenesis protein CcmH/NrfG